MNKVIEIIVSPTGETRLETKGFSGAECREASKFVEKALGVPVGEQMTAESHAENNRIYASNNQGSA